MRFGVKKFVICVALFGTPNRGAAEPNPTKAINCEVLFTSLSSTLKGKIDESIHETKDADLFKKIEVSNNDLDTLNGVRIEENVRFPLGKPERLLKNLLSRLVPLPVSEKKILIENFRNASPFTKSLVNTQIMLALGDKDTWSRFAKWLVLESNDENFYFQVKSFWAHEVTRMPIEDQLMVIEVVSNHYDTTRSPPDAHWSPKRSFDYLFQAAFQGGERIRALVGQGKSPIEAYGELLRVQNKLLFKRGSRRGNYNEDVVLAVLRAIQEKLQDDLPVLIGGSFPAGRANLLKSDVDYVISGLGLFPEQERQVSRAINTKLKNMGIEAKLKFQNFPGEIGEPIDSSYPDDLASSSSVLFFIDRKKLEMRVYPTNFWQSGHPPEAFMANPEIFDLQ